MSSMDMQQHSGTTSTSSGKPHSKQGDDRPIVHGNGVAPHNVSIWISLWTLCVREAYAVTLWSFASFLLRCSMYFLSESYAETPDDAERTTLADTKALVQDYHPILKVAVGVAVKMILFLRNPIVRLIPNRMRLNQAPGFIFANPWILLWVEAKTNVVANVPIRICHCALGRLRVFELFAVLPIHFTATYTCGLLMRYIAPNHLSAAILDPIVYAENSTKSDHYLFLEIGTEILVVVAYTTLFMIVPVLFQLNRLPRWPAMLILLPLFHVPVEKGYMSSPISPNAVLALDGLAEGKEALQSLSTSMHLLGIILGGLLGSVVMWKYFPDEKTK